MQNVYRIQSKGAVKMNILHMKYAVEVAKLGSLSKAAETLLIAQPNLSRSIKELEADLGITVFSRSAKGMVLTPHHSGAPFHTWKHKESFQMSLNRGNILINSFQSVGMHTDYR